jgi:hypothetical protein
MAHVEGNFRAFRVDNGISLVVVIGGEERRIHVRRKNNAALYNFLEDHMTEPEQGDR